MTQNTGVLARETYAEGRGRLDGGSPLSRGPPEEPSKSVFAEIRNRMVTQQIALRQLRADLWNTRDKLFGAEGPSAVAKGKANAPQLVGEVPLTFQDIDEIDELIRDCTVPQGHMATLA